MATSLERIRSLLGSTRWPNPAQAAIWEEVEFFRALRVSDEVRIRQHASVAWNYPYMLTPIPRMISRASANMLFGEPPQINAADEADQERLDFIVDENDLTSELHRGAVIASSEGEVWGRIVVQPSVLDAPIIEFVSREQVIPHFSGRFVTGATFIQEWQEGTNDFLRLFEHYEAGIIRSELYRGTRTALGVKIDLTAYDRTRNVAEQVVTGIPRPLCAFVPNSIDADPQRGFSDYRGLEDRFLALNESSTIGQQNMRLAGRKRALIDSSYMKDGKPPVGDDVFLRKDANASMDGSSKPLELLEYSFDASAITAWVDHILDTTLLLSGVAPQSVGRSVDGGAISGTALRLKMAHTLVESSGKGRFFDRGTRRLLQYAAMIDARRTTEGGFGRKWSSREPELPSIERADALPRDDMEAANRLVLLTNAQAISLEEKVRAVHPEWDKEQVDEEVDRINGEAPEPLADPTQIPTQRPVIELS